MNFKRLFLAAIFLIAITPLVSLAQFDEGTKYVTPVLVASVSTLQPGSSPEIPVAQIGVHFKIEPGWHIYWQNSGEAGLPTKVRFNLPEGWKGGELKWPMPITFIERGDITTYAYENETLLFTDLFAPTTVDASTKTIKLGADLKWLVCKDLCLPGQKYVEVEIPFSPDEPLTPSKEYPLFDNYKKLIPSEKANFDGFTLEKVQVVKSQDTKLNTTITLTTSPPLTSPEKHFQVFPFNDGALKLGAPKIASSADNKSHQITIPLEILEDQAVVPNEIAGVLVASKTVTGALHDVGINFTASLLEQVSEVDNSFDNLPSKDLTFKYHSYKDEKVAPLTQNSESDLATLLGAILFGYLAGIVLNFMPCVLPIISIKVLSFLKNTENSSREAFRSALLFSSGILATFLFLALNIIVLRSLGTQLGWGFQFQYPEFVVPLTVVVFILSLGFFNILHFNMPFMQGFNKRVNALQNDAPRQFFDGILATLLSTPCTAPFLGTALAFAFTAPAWAIVLIFLSIGLGLATPYIILSTNQRLLNLVPKPGNWMYRVREFMGFLLLATVIWLLHVISFLTETGVIWTLVLLLLIHLTFWLKSWISETSYSDTKKSTYTLIVLVLLFSSAVYLWPSIIQKKSNTAEISSKHINWVAFAEAVIDEARATKKPIFIDFTAEWCITCKANETLVIETEATSKLLALHGIKAVKADWTTGDEKVGDLMNELGGNGVPFYALISGDKTIVLPTVLTPSILEEGFQKISK